MLKRHHGVDRPHRARPRRSPMLEPVFVGGSTVGLATLHNEDQVRAKDVRPGDTVIVRKAGDVIPEVVGPVLAERPEGPAQRGRSRPTCPVCGGPLVRLEGESDTLLHQRRLPGADRRPHRATSRPAARWTSRASASGRVRAVPSARPGDRPGDIYTLDLATRSRRSRASATISVQQPAATPSRRRRRGRSPNLLVGAQHPPPRGHGRRPAGRGPSASLDRIMDAAEEDIAAVDGVGPTIAEERARVLRRRAATAR